MINRKALCNCTEKSVRMSVESGEVMLYTQENQFIGGASWKVLK